MRYPSLESTSPVTSNPRGREKRSGRLAGNGRGFGRGGGSFVPTLHQIPPQEPPRPDSVRVGSRIIGAYVCPACRTRTTTLVRQLPTSTMNWVCSDWCSPRDPRTTPFVSTQESNK